MGITDIEYNATKEMEYIYGAGDTPQYIAEGKKSFSGSIDLLQNEYEALVEEAKKRGGNDITDLEVSITVSYLPSLPGDAAQLSKMVVDRISGVKFTGGSKKISTGDGFMKVNLPFMALSIQTQL